SKADELVETAIDLGPGLTNGLGQLVVIVEPDISLLSSIFKPGQRPPAARAWVQATRIGLDAFVDGDQMIAWANDLANGAPLNGVAFSLLTSGGGATANDAGVATLALPGGSAAGVLVGRKGSDLAILPQNTYFWGDGGWQRQARQDELRWYVFDDRTMYRPGEEVHVKGWMRRIGSGKDGDVGLIGGVVRQVSYRVRDSRGNEVLNGTAAVNALGGFDFAFTLKDTMNLGYTSLEITSDGPSDIGGRTYNHQFQVQEFRRPEFEVKATASEGPFLVNGAANVSVAANYYAGGGLPNADVTWRVSWRSGQYTPPGWDDFTFGTWIPWWRDVATLARSPSSGPVRVVSGGEANVETFTGKTDASGVHRLKLDFGPVDPPGPTVYTAEASVMDVNRQAWNSSASLLVHPASLYVGLRSDRMFVQREQPLKIHAIVTDLDGKPVAGKAIAIRTARLDWQLKSGVWQEVEVAPQPCTVTSAKEPVTCTFETPEGGTYRIVAAISDDQGRVNRTEFTRWVSGGQRPPARQVEQEEVTLIPDKKDYRPGDTAEILVQSPFFPAEGVLTLRRSGIVESSRFTMSGPTYTVKVPIKESYIPNLYVQVDLVGAASRTDDAGNPKPDLPKRPAYATGQLNLSVPPLARTLKLDVAPRDARLEPGGKTTVDVTVKDAAGKPVSGAELAVVVVDEAVLALSNYDLADPMSVFYSSRDDGASDYHTRASIVLANPEDLTEQVVAGQALSMERAVMMPAAAAPSATAAPAAAPKMAAGAMDNAAEPAPVIAVRTDFNALATFAASVPTDAQGKATVEVKVPDNLTRYRVMVVAVSGGKQFGKGESAITARLPLMVRPSAPRFLNFGDKFELPIVLQNQTDAAMTVDVAVRGTNIALVSVPLAPQSGGNATSPNIGGQGAAAVGKRVTVPANDRVEVRFPATTVSAGTARFQVAAASGKWADAASFELPVWTPATTEAFAVYGVLDQGAVAQPVIAPSNVFTQFGGLEITTSSTALQALTDAFLYLQAYPFECSEQLSSRILAVAALRDVLTAFRAEGLPAPAAIEAAMARDIERLRGMQNSDGGWPVWIRGYETWPYHSIHVAHALARARQKGYTVPADMLTKSQNYLRNIERSIPSWYSEDARRSLIAYALYVRKLNGDADPTRARSLIKEAGGVEKLSFEALGWLMPTLSDDPNSQAEIEALRRHLNNRVTETAGAAHFVTSYGDQGYVLLHSDRRADGILLDALIGDQPQSDLIPKLVTGLLAQRVAGRWANTQENAFILLALDRYFNTYEAQTPDFVARIWLGDGYAGDATFRGRTTEYQQITIPMSYLANVPGTSQVPGTSTLILSKEGAGRLYYRLGLRYAPTDLKLPPYDAGFTVERVYEAVDKSDDVTRDKDGTWHIKAGARVRVRLTMVAPARRYHVALVDPLPAGLEGMNPALAVTGNIPQDPKNQTGVNAYWWWWRTWYEHQNMRDERVEAFASLLWEGVHTYTYVARATTPGTFIVPPTKAEEMYAPETFGRGAVDVVVVQ
ncbi:MAG: MG2 domain-containing protein, partial [Chloroflexi bacterium]|nr:MG2 domain-containing protein [Chloroflexota bacterium]